MDKTASLSTFQSAGTVPVRNDHQDSLVRTANFVSRNSWNTDTEWTKLVDTLISQL